MAMDVLRTGCRMNAWVGSDNDEQVELRWYKCAEGAKAFPHFHAFGSPMWEPDTVEWTEGPGVDRLPLTWVPKDIAAPPGQEFHGPVSWYQKGIPQAVLDNPEPWEHEPCVPEVVPDVCNIRLSPVATDPDRGRLRVDFQDFTF
jgi:hypothetical protein